MFDFFNRRYTVQDFQRDIQNKPTFWPQPTHQPGQGHVSIATPDKAKLPSASKEPLKPK